MGSAEENQLIRKVLSGDEEAFSDILKIYLNPVYNFVYRFVFDRDVAEDLVQETFVKVWKNIKRFDEKRNFKTWLFAIAKNTTFDYLKKKKELPFSKFTNEEGDNVLENIAGDEFLPDEILARSEIAEEMENILQKLQPHYRAILLLHYKEDFSLHEISEILDEPYNTIKSRHQRGISRLKQKLLGGNAP